MGHYHTIPDSAFSGAGDFIENSTLNGYITGSVAADELCCLLESGSIVRADPNLPWAALNQSNPDLFLVRPTYAWDNVVLGAALVIKAVGHVARLSNRCYCVPLQHATLGIGFSLRTSAGLEITNFVSVSADLSTAPPYVIPLAGDGFAILWHVSATLKCAIYDGSGNLVTAAFTISTTVSVSGMVPWHGHARLTNGTIAVTWTTTSNALHGIIFGPTGTIIVSEFVIDASCSGNAHMVAACANGDFLVACFDVSHNRHNVYRVTVSGTLVFGPVVRSTATVQFSYPDAARQHPQHNRIFELAGPDSLPNFVVMLPDSDGYCKAYVHDYAGNLTVKVDIGTTYHNSGVQDGAVWMPQGFCIAHGGNTTQETRVSFFDWNGHAVGQNKLLDSGGHHFTTAGTPAIYFYPGWAGTGISIGRYAYLQGAEHRVIHCDLQGNLIGSPFNPQSFGSDDICCPFPLADVDGTVKFVVFASVRLAVVSTVVKVGRSSIIGVAQASATNGQAVTVVGVGYYRLPSTQVFPLGSTFDQRTAAVPGCRGVVGQNTAALFGWGGALPSPSLVPTLGGLPV